MGIYAGLRKQSKETRRADAIARNDAWSKLSTEQKIAELDKRLGVDVGAKKQRKRLAKEVQA